VEACQLTVRVASSDLLLVAWQIASRSSQLTAELLSTMALWQPVLGDNKQRRFPFGSRSVITLILAAMMLLAGAVGLYTRLDYSGPSYALGVPKVSLDAVDAPAGYTYYLLTVNASNSGTSGWQ